MERKVGIDKPVTVNGVTVVTVTKSVLTCRHINNHISCFGTKQPFLIAVISKTERQFFDITGQEVLLDQLTQNITDIKEIVKQISAL